MSSKPSVRFFLAGGAACNIGRELYRRGTAGEVQPGFAEVKLTFVDTSRSNIPAGVTDELYLIQGMSDVKIDGSGKVRTTNYEPVKIAIPEILHRFTPGDLNVVIHSASGGKLTH